MIAAIMPCRGRAEQTVENVRRLLATAGDVEWRLYLVGASQDTEALRGCTEHASLMGVEQSRVTYWQALQFMTEEIERTRQYLRQTPISLIANLANDLWACDDWLSEALAEYREHFGSGDGLLGFAGDGHGPQHSCHFLISRGLLDRYGGWPIWYQHNFGDRELCARAQQDGVYAKATRAWLEHCHVERGLAVDDAVYQAGRASYRRDEALFVERRAAGWPQIKNPL